MGKTLIGIAGCHKFWERANGQRQTWIKDVGSAADVRFFLGTPHSGIPAAGEVWLDCPDGYEERKQKVMGMIKWALDENYDYLWKVDDDVYLRPERLLSLDAYDYCGAITQNRTVFSGAIYGLSRASMEKLLMPDTRIDQKFEDIWVWNRLTELGVKPTDMAGPDGFNGRFRMTHERGKPVPVGQETASRTNDVIATWEHQTPDDMQKVHAIFQVGA